jgi:hypothetical protein
MQLTDDDFDDEGDVGDVEDAQNHQADTFPEAWAFAVGGTVFLEAG